MNDVFQRRLNVYSENIKLLCCSNYLQDSAPNITTLNTYNPCSETRGGGYSWWNRRVFEDMLVQEVKVISIIIIIIIISSSIIIPFRGVNMTNESAGQLWYIAIS